MAATSWPIISLSSASGRIFATGTKSLVIADKLRLNLKVLGLVWHRKHSECLLQVAGVDLFEILEVLGVGFSLPTFRLQGLAV